MYSLIDTDSKGIPYFYHPGPKHYVDLYKREFDLPMVQVIVKEDKNGEYYGWIDKGEKEPEMIWRGKGLFSMCFPYGPEEEVKRGRGEIVRLSIVEKKV